MIYFRKPFTNLHIKRKT